MLPDLLTDLERKLWKQGKFLELRGSLDDVFGLHFELADLAVARRKSWTKLNSVEVRETALMFDDNLLHQLKFYQS